MNLITSENVHIWEGSNSQIMVDLQFVNWKSVTSHPLLSFKTVDDAINSLYLKGFKDSARELNKLK